MDNIDEHRRKESVTGPPTDVPHDGRCSRCGRARRLCAADDREESGEDEKSDDLELDDSSPEALGMRGAILVD